MTTTLDYQPHQLEKPFTANRVCELHPGGNAVYHHFLTLSKRELMDGAKEFRIVCKRCGCWAEVYEEAKAS